MALRKVKYTQQEAEYMVSKVKSEYEDKLARQKQLNIELSDELKQVKAEFLALKEKEELIYLTLERAEKTAIEIEKSTKEQYELEVERLKRFVQRWNNYFKVLKDDYPENPTLKKAINLKEMVEAAANSDGAKKLISDLDTVLTADDRSSEGEAFDPQKKINEYIAATGNNGFNLDEVLNPGELRLEDICKELGLMGGNE